MMFDLNQKELRILRSLRTPAKIQDFLDRFPMNFETHGETCMSPRRTLREGHAHCMEGAMLAAAALRVQGYPPLILDLTAVPEDDDHVLAIFQLEGSWGAISKTNHAVLRYREPIYRSIRELAFSYFHEYFLKDGRKTLRSYAGPINLSQFDRLRWMTTEEDLFAIPRAIVAKRHFPFLTPLQKRRLRRADKIEREAGKLVEWKKSDSILHHEEMLFP